MQQKDRHHRQPADQAVRIQQREQVARVHHVLIDRHSLRKIGKGRAEQQGRQERSDRDHPVEGPPPARAGVLGSVLECDASHDQPHQQQEKCQVEAAEHGRIPMRKRRKRGPARGQQPHFIAVPGGPDGVDDGTAFFVLLAQERQQHTDAEIESLEEIEADPQDRDQDEPDDSKRSRETF